MTVQSALYTGICTVKSISLCKNNQHDNIGTLITLKISKPMDCSSDMYSVVTLSYLTMSVQYSRMHHFFSNIEFSAKS